MSFDKQLAKGGPDRDARSVPGALVLVVGPSGAGKDTLIEGARRVLDTSSAASRFQFPRRAIDRPAHASEDFISVPSSAFETEQATSDFALYWSAHGTHYGVPASIKSHLASGGIVIVNISRTVVARARELFPNVRVIAITCPPEIRARRLAQRGRETASEITARVERTVSDLNPALVDHTIENSGPPEQGIAQLVEILRQLADASGPAVAHAVSLQHTDQP